MSRLDTPWPCVHVTLPSSRAHTDEHDDRLESITGPVEPFKDAAFMSPEMLAGKLRALYANRHVCRTNQCDHAVDHCGDFCARCQEEIAALKAHYDAQGRIATKAAAAFWPIAGIVVLVFSAIGLVWAKMAGWL